MCTYINNEIHLQVLPFAGRGKIQISWRQNSRTRSKENTDINSCTQKVFEIENAVGHFQ